MSLEDQTKQIKYNKLSFQEQQKIAQKTKRETIPPKMNLLLANWGRRYYDMEGFEVATVQIKKGGNNEN